MIRNKIRVVFFLEDGCSQEEGEVGAHWTPINFAVYSDLFPELIKLAIDEWIDDNPMVVHTEYEVIFAHVIEHDGGGAVLGESFVPIHTETQQM